MMVKPRPAMLLSCSSAVSSSLSSTSRQPSSCIAIPRCNLDAPTSPITHSRGGKETCGRFSDGCRNTGTTMKSDSKRRDDKACASASDFPSTSSSAATIITRRDCSSNVSKRPERRSASFNLLFALGPPSTSKRSFDSAAPALMRFKRFSFWTYSRRHKKPRDPRATRSIPKLGSVSGFLSRNPVTSARRAVKPKYVAMPAAPKSTGSAKRRNLPPGFSTSLRSSALSCMYIGERFVTSARPK
mmetsp:Transcript_78668/g.130285  ORF Transcript_78668/g.130285 Transcript_78668/m.130285 type:complete len:243 (-) Transcript_78668:382-1110(-)